MMKCYLVGGAVRDELLGLPVVDRDWVVVGATPEEMLKQGYQAVGQAFPVFLHPKTKEEYALARTERKTGKGYKGFTFHCDESVTLEEDLQRRDLTLNAIAKTDSGELVDPYGGIADIKQRILRHVSPAFSEDPVRCLRVARFAARFSQQGFVVHDKTKALLRDMVDSGEIDALVPERVWQEIEKALQTDSPWIFFECLQEVGALARIMPELAQLWGVPNPVEHHPEVDSGIHTMLVLQQACLLSKDPTVRFAALCHDLGKGITDPEKWPKHHGHEEKGVDLVKALCKRLKAPNPFRDLAILAAKYHGKVHSAKTLKATTVVKLLTETDAYRKTERFESLLLACIADSRGRTGYETVEYPQADFLRQALTVSQGVDVSEWVAAGCPGQQIKEKLYQARVSLVKRLY